MNNKRQKQRERKGVIDGASADTAPSWLTPVLLFKKQDKGEALGRGTHTKKTQRGQQPLKCPWH